jgi:galactose mutarotase-like enzyme
MPELRTYRLTGDGPDVARAEIVPQRGGIVTRFFAAGREVLALDESTLRDPAKNVRGGIPVLFPAPGKLRDGRALLGGVGCQMKQHGFARDLPWCVIEERPAALTLALDSSETTRRLFPFDFRLTFTFALEGPSLRIDQRYENLSKEPMPLHAGFHPYFLVPDGEKPRATITTRATRVFDNVTKAERAFEGFDLTLPEVDLHLVDHGGSRSTLTRPDGKGVVEIEASPEFGRWVVWTLAGKDFVCVEPWTAPADALNTGERLIWLEPGDQRRLWMRLTAS